MTDWREYQKFRMDLIEETRTAGLTPGQVAGYLEGNRHRFPKWIEDYEIQAYRRSPDDWRNVVLPS